MTLDLEPTGSQYTPEYMYWPNTCTSTRVYEMNLSTCIDQYMYCQPSTCIGQCMIGQYQYELLLLQSMPWYRLVEGTPI